jgi:tRNA G18 (ribose-2'-O)-methylase SpoU
MRLTTTSEFEGISVSAGAWIEMEEVCCSLGLALPLVGVQAASSSQPTALVVALLQVKPKHAHTFLSRLKKEGYAVVGLEQTSTSVSLEKVRLPERMVLLLGHEKVGIPSELLQLVDLVVEIPQMGIIRSLNVHVSGAMFLWEYTKQHGLK